MLYLIAASLTWSFSFGLLHQIRELDPLAVSLLRLGLAALMFLPFIRGGSTMEILARLGIGIVQFGLMYCLYISSFRYLSPSEAAILTLTTPLWVLLLEALETRSFRLKHWLAGLMALGGALLVKPPDALIDHGRGIALIQGANLCFALGQTLFKRWKGGGAVAPDMAWLYLGACLAPAAMLLGKGDLAQHFHFQPRQWLALLYLGLIPSGLGFYLWNKGVTRSSLAAAAVCNNLKIPLGVLVSVLVFRDKVSWLNVAPAFALMLTALLLVSRKAS
jgi:drug/metabolite transporter (DMT)-like permease